MLNTNAQSVDFDCFGVRSCVQVGYTAPPTGRASINLYDETGDIVLHVDYRVSWGFPLVQDTVILNTRIKGIWGTEERVTGVNSTTGTDLKWLICSQETNFLINLNQMELATYAYRTNTQATRLEFASSEYDSTCGIV